MRPNRLTNRHNRINQILLAITLTLYLLPAGAEPNHSTTPTATNRNQSSESIPSLVPFSPFLLGDGETPPMEQTTYTLVATNIPIRELLFSLARKARMNVDLMPGVQGSITLNLTNQTLPSLLERIAQQSNMLYRIQNNTLLIKPNTLYMAYDQPRTATNRPHIPTSANWNRE